MWFLAHPVLVEQHYFKSNLEILPKYLQWAEGREHTCATLSYSQWMLLEVTHHFYWFLFKNNNFSTVAEAGLASWQLTQGGSDCCSLFSLRYYFTFQFVNSLHMLWKTLLIYGMKISDSDSEGLIKSPVGQLKEAFWKSEIWCLCRITSTLSHPGSSLIASALKV